MAENEMKDTAGATTANSDVSIAGMHEYGYHYANMTPLAKEKALELFDEGKEIYLLFEGDTESAAESRKEIEDFGGLLGYEANTDARLTHEQAELFDEAAASGTDAGDTFSIYQLKQSEETRPYRWMSVSDLKSAGLSVRRDNYEHIYTAPLPVGTDLESIFAKFNMDRPPDFRGHSLSVSDIVSLDRGGKQTAYYVDNTGFVNVTELMAMQGEHSAPKDMRQHKEKENDNIMEDCITKCECYIHSLKQGEHSALAEATIIKKLGDNDYLAEYNGVKCHATFNPIVGHYYVDDKYGVIADADIRDNNYMKNAELGTGQNHNQTSGLLNNLPDDEAKEKPSVKGRLKEAGKSVAPPPKNHKAEPDKGPGL
jgi:hypothetical protein